MLHLIKLSVGPKDLTALRRLQAQRLKDTGELFHRTRMVPKRAAELLDGGSIYWVVAGFVQVRQRLLDLREEEWAGRRGVALMLEPRLVPVAARAMKPFQGWRYLETAAAPPDLADDAEAQGSAALPEALRQELRNLGLL